MKIISGFIWLHLGISIIESCPTYNEYSIHGDWVQLGWIAVKEIKSNCISKSSGRSLFLPLPDWPLPLTGSGSTVSITGTGGLLLCKGTWWAASFTKQSFLNPEWPNSWIVMPGFDARLISDLALTSYWLWTHYLNFCAFVFSTV